MRVFRLCRPQFSSLDGEGAKQYGGRWNERGCPVVYTSSTLSLALLELLVHVDIDLIPTELSNLEIDIPETIAALTINLPRAYLKSKDESLLKAVGTTWLQGKKTALLSVPSMIVPSERNVLINPLHPDANKIKIIHKKPFFIDPRLLA